MLQVSRTRRPSTLRWHAATQRCADRERFTRYRAVDTSQASKLHITSHCGSVPGRCSAGVPEDAPRYNSVARVRIRLATSQRSAKANPLCTSPFWRKNHVRNGKRAHGYRRAGGTPDPQRPALPPPTGVVALLRWTVINKSDAMPRSIRRCASVGCVLRSSQRCEKQFCAPGPIVESQAVIQAH